MNWSQFSILVTMLPRLSTEELEDLRTSLDKVIAERRLAAAATSVPAEVG